jgi:LacI family transcriptional regulator
MSSATISDVAKKVGVSESTVSRYISGFKVRKAKAIKKAIIELDYRPNIVARNLKSGKTGIIAVIVPDIMNPFFAAIVQGAEAAAGDDYMVQLVNTGESLEREEWALRQLIGRVDGCIYVPAREDSASMRILKNHSLPVVFVDRVIGAMSRVDSVLADNYQGGALAANHLAEHGHSKIAIVTGPLTSTPGKERARGFTEALLARGISTPPGYIIESDFSELGGYQGAISLLQSKKPPTALFLANNFMTVGALKACQEKGVRIPEDLAIIGFDDLQLSELVDPPLTVIARDALMQGAHAMSTLLERVREGDQFPLQHLKVEVSLIARGSCGSTCRYSNPLLKSGLAVSQ